MEEKHGRIWMMGNGKMDRCRWCVASQPIYINEERGDDHNGLV
jgi:hypothetical protein